MPTPAAKSKGVAAGAESLRTAVGAGEGEAADDWGGGSFWGGRGDPTGRRVGHFEILLIRVVEACQGPNILHRKE